MIFWLRGVCFVGDMVTLGVGRHDEKFEDEMA